MRNWNILLILLTLCSPAPLMQAELGCIDNSRHLAAWGDPKDYHLVACTCPCARYQRLADRGQCTECHHFRDPRPFIIVEPSKDKHVAASIKKMPLRSQKGVTWGIKGS